ncbi:hypothetical protein IGI04_041485 [Brassica rapa subsp. trilocularis]|uniref:Uncharacterized protein n=1 Tax=Brassica rapa subsp. trilocularis TaxID=1813537 RepID=A0ABQ7KUB4_BRACM|nr:hypothetical protein IGI04_041485 [Brassica rapa subsp. trilocularis]
MANRRVSSRTRKVAAKMAAALTSTDNRTQAAIARLEALENDNGALEVVDLNDDEKASLDEEDDLALLQGHFCSCNIPNPLSKTSPPIYPTKRTIRIIESIRDTN